MLKKWLGFRVNILRGTIKFNATLRNVKVLVCFKALEMERAEFNGIMNIK